MKTNTFKKIIFIFITLVVLVVIDFILISRLNKERDIIIETRKNIVLESSQAVGINETKQKIEELEKINERIDNLLIKESNAVKFISLIENLAEDVGVEITIASVNFEDPEDENKLGTLDMNFQIVGSWQEVTTFLVSVESLPYLIDVNAVRFSAGQNRDIDDGEDGSINRQWSVSFNLKGTTD